MRKIFSLSILNPPCIRSPICRKRKALQVVKMDGKVMEFKAPIMVKELLIKFEGFGVKSSRKCSKLLSPSFELQMGKTYYLLPLMKSPDQAKNHVDSTICTKARPETVKRIKVVITKKQLQELLAKKASVVEKIIFGLDSTNSGLSWKPSLRSIPEENELNAV